jgi:hypothetical protein
VVVTIVTEWWELWCDHTCQYEVNCDCR